MLKMPRGSMVPEIPARASSESARGGALWERVEAGSGSLGASGSGWMGPTSLPLSSCLLVCGLDGVRPPLTHSTYSHELERLIACSSVRSPAPPPAPRSISKDSLRPVPRSRVSPVLRHLSIKPEYGNTRRERAGTIERPGVRVPRAS